jgi:hypothetical protein
MMPQTVGMKKYTQFVKPLAVKINSHQRGTIGCQMMLEDELLPPYATMDDLNHQNFVN